MVIEDNGIYIGIKLLQWDMASTFNLLTVFAKISIMDVWQGPNLTEQMCPLSFLFNLDNFMKDLCGVLTFMDGSPKQFVWMQF